MALYNTEWDGITSAMFDCQQLALMGDVPSRLQVQANILAGLGTTNLVLAAPATDTYPNWVWCGNNNQQVIYISGMSMLSQAVGIVEGYALRPSAFPFQGVNRWFANAALQIFNIARGAMNTTGKIRLVGHSAGGAVALALGRYIRLVTPTPPDIEIVTYGSPKPGNRDFAIAVSSYRVARFMLAIDPVPLVAPTLADLVAARIPWTTLGAESWQGSVQPGGGVSLDGNFTLNNRALPSVAQMTPFTSLATWLFNIDNQASALHSVSSYLTYMTMFQSAQVGGGDWNPDPEHSPPEVANVISPRQSTTAEERVRSAVSVASEEQHRFPVSLPEERIFIAKKLGGLWVVEFDTEVVSIEGNKRHARAVARLGNEFLKRLQTSAVVDPPGFLTQMKNYLSAATDPAAGFTPTMNVFLPQ